MVLIMAFKTERDLQLTLTALDLRLAEPCTATFIRREVPIGRCIPDVIYVRFSTIPRPDLWPRRWSFRHAHILWLLRETPHLRPETIASLSYERLERIQPLLDELRRSGAVVRSSFGTLSLSDEFASVVADVIAAEAKLQLWRQALSQAMTYRHFANRTFVAMDATTTPRAPEVLAQFRTNQIGLCAVDSKSLEWLVYPPRHTEPMGPDREYLITSAATPIRQHLWARRYETNASFQA
jgi:hypothetical protein